MDAAPGPRLRLLIVDDDEEARVTYRRGLEAHFELELASGVADALAVLDRASFHAVVSDDRMPDGRGVDLLRAVAQKTPDTVRLLLTGYAPIGVGGLLTSGVIHAILHKPLLPAELETRVCDELAFRRSLTPPFGRPKL